jgi:predicted nucleotidyltransferase
MQSISPENIPNSDEIKIFLKNFKNLSYHDDIIKKALNIAKNIKGVDAVFLLGSLADDTADIFSDIDFFIMYEKEDLKEQIFKEFLKELDKLGPIIHISGSSANPYDIIIYIKPYIKFELALRSFKSMKKKWKIAEKAKLVFDRKGLGKKAIKKAEKISFSMKKYEREIQNLALGLPSFCYIIGGYMIRGEHVTSIDFVAWIRRLMLRVSGFLLGMWDEGTRRAELRFPTELIDYYHKCKIGNVEEIWQCLQHFLAWFSEWLVPRFEEQHIIHANEEVKMIKKILNELEKSYRVG